jgi:hypothetical protein
MFNLCSQEKVFQEVRPVIDYRVRGLCKTPYPDHPAGCPNFKDSSHSYRCPPGAPLFDKYFTMGYPIYVVFNGFDLAGHVDRMKSKHPEWSKRQLECVLYWQQTARKQLQNKVEYSLTELPDYEATWCPEGMGVDVTTTVLQIGLNLWSIKDITYQIALLGRRV